jgi:flagellar biosynthesis/type III secretory pathway protein FliH
MDETTMQGLMAQLEALKAENEALKKAKTAGLSYKVSEKGAVSVYGMGRFPVTLYASQWETLFANKEAVEAFIVANKSKLSTTEDREARKAEQAANERLARVAASGMGQGNNPANAYATGDGQPGYKVVKVG